MIEEIDELICLWIYRYKNINEIFVPLNPNCSIRLKPNYNNVEDSFLLNIEESNIVSIYGENINLMTLVGENGSGKTNITSALARILRSPQEFEIDDYYNNKFPETTKYCLVYKIKPTINNRDSYRYKSNIKNCNITINGDIATEANNIPYSCSLFRPFSNIEDDESIQFTMDNKLKDTNKIKLRNYFYYDRFRSYEVNHSLEKLYSYNNEKPFYFLKDKFSYLFFDLKAREINVNKRTVWLKRRFNINAQTYFRPKMLNEEYWSLTEKVNDLFDNLEKESNFTFANFKNEILPLFCLTYFYINIAEMYSRLGVTDHKITPKILEEGIFTYLECKEEPSLLHEGLEQYYCKIKGIILSIINNNEIKEKISYEGYLNTLLKLLDTYIQNESKLANIDNKNSFENYLEIVDGNLFVAKRKNMIPLSDIKEYTSDIIKRNTDIMNFLNNLGVFEINYYNYRNESQYSFKELSTGEQRLLKFFADFVAMLDETNIFIMDEMDLSYHPEWQREFINILVDCVNNISRVSNHKINIIYTTHSPIILSDMTKYSVVLLKKNPKTNFIDTKEADIKTFGTNIHSLYSHPFFMKSTIGEFVEKKIKETIEYLQCEIVSKETLNKICATIDLMEDGVEKNILLTMTQDYKNRLENYEKNK